MNADAAIDRLWRQLEAKHYTKVERENIRSWGRPIEEPDHEHSSICQVGDGKVGPKCSTTKCTRGHTFIPCPGKEKCRWEYGPHEGCHQTTGMDYGGAERCGNGQETRLSIPPTPPSTEVLTVPFGFDIVRPINVYTGQPGSVHYTKVNKK